MIEELKKNGVIIEKVYYCPHIGNECNCRKPKLGLFYQAQKEYDIDFSKSYAIGDKTRDLEICEKEDVRGFLLNNEDNVQNDKIKKCSNLLEAARMIEKIEKDE